MSIYTLYTTITEQIDDIVEYINTKYNLTATPTTDINWDGHIPMWDSITALDIPSDTIDCQEIVDKFQVFVNKLEGNTFGRTEHQSNHDLLDMFIDNVKQITATTINTRFPIWRQLNMSTDWSQLNSITDLTPTQLQQKADIEAGWAWITAQRQLSNMTEQLIIDHPDEYESILETFLQQTKSQ